MRNHDLSIGLGTEGTRLKKRLAVEHTSSVHVLTSSHIIKGISHAIEVGEEFVAIDICRWSAMPRPVIWMYCTHFQSQDRPCHREQ